MAKARTNKVVCYIVRDGWILTFRHLDHPLSEVGIQVPAGTMKPGETPEHAALREAREETGLTTLQIVRKLGEADYDISPYRHEVMRRHFFEITTDDAPAAPWIAGEPDPDDGGTGSSWECRWVPLEQAHVLAGGLSNMIGALVDE